MTSTPSLALPSFDPDGFMREMEHWNEETARRIASEDGLGDLDERQITLVRQLRTSYQRLGALPAWTHVCHLAGFGPDCMTRLFPDAREAWRIAGLPNPGEEAKAYL
ncbi:MAG: TusE/DsrC/DsvC family sulfur relay protein [Betaproteobacteria bacterium]|nr:TusE/DsrC/DsvC family sulfur relay protein [Betaproteobacteria bacterium]